MLNADFWGFCLWLCSQKAVVSLAHQWILSLWKCLTLSLWPPPRWEVPICLTDNPANRRWRSGFFLSWTGGRWIHYLCPFQPLRTGGRRSTWLQRRAAHPSLSPRGPLMWQRHRSRGRGASSSHSTWLPARSSSSRLNGHWSQPRRRLPGKRKQIHLVGSNTQPGPCRDGSW